MTSPGFNVIFDPAFDVYSIPVNTFSLPAHWDIYLPDNQTGDFNCRSVICPNPEAGSTIWTRNGKYIAVGVYRDEGRPATQFPFRTGLPWQRIGNQIIFTDTQPHGLVVGDKVNLANVNVNTATGVSVINVYNATQFAANTGSIGATAGVDGAYQPSRIKNFFEENLVFRYLPDFRLVPATEILQLFTDSAPSQDYSTRYLNNLTTNQTVLVPRVRNENVDYSTLEEKLNQIFRATAQPDLRFNQAFDEDGEELEIKYNEAGFPLTFVNVDSPFSNEQVRYNQPLVRELPLPDESPDSDDRVYCYDFYGFEINDPTRSPFFAIDLVVRDETVALPPPVLNNIELKEQNGQPLYAGGFIQDVYGSKVIAIQENNATVVRKQILPLALDIFNRPVKLPYTRVTSS